MNGLFPLSYKAIAALGQVIVIDLVLAGDNAVVIGLAAAGLAPERRGRAILIGIAAATVLRIAFAIVAVDLLAIIGLLLAGGILLLWVAWKMWRELRAQRPAGAAPDGAAAPRENLGAGRLADRAGGRFDVARQRLGGGGRRARSHRGAGDWARPVDRADGICREPDRPVARSPALDRLCRACNRALCRARHDLARVLGKAAHAF